MISESYYARILLTGGAATLQESMWTAGKRAAAQNVGKHLGWLGFISL